MFESLYLVYTVVVLLFLTPLVLSLGKDVGRALFQSVRALFMLPFWISRLGVGPARARYSRAIPLTILQYGLLLFLLAVNFLIIVVGMSGEGSLLKPFGMRAAGLIAVLLAIHWSFSVASEKHIAD